MQRTDDWVRVRLGRITASRFGDVMASPDTVRWANYRNDLVDQRIGLVNFRNWVHKPWFDHGVENEPLALAAYAFYATTAYPDVTIETLPSFIPHPMIPIGCSPDVLLRNPDGTIFGGGEMKCRATMETHAKALKKLSGDYLAQIQGTMWITNTQWWDYGNFCLDPAVPKDQQFVVQRIHRDDAYILNLAKAVLRMDTEVQKLVDDIMHSIGETA